MLARQMQLAALERTALTDESTGLGNRQAFLADLHREVAFATRHSSGFALHLIEIANIRFMNATAGYAGGNDAILALVQTLNGVRRTEDRAYRLNGATFAVLLRSAPGRAASPDGPPDERQNRPTQGWPGRLRSALEGLLGRTPALNLHVGQALFPTGADSASELFRTALEDLGPLTVPAPTRRRSDAVSRD
jgi:GGDEF domain-containing protein